MAPHDSNLMHIRIKYLATLSMTFLLIFSTPFHPESGIKDFYNILDFGAVEGGDRIDIPPDMFLPAPLSLKSNVNPHIEINLVLLRKRILR